MNRPSSKSKKTTSLSNTSIWSPPSIRYRIYVFRFKWKINCCNKNLGNENKMALLLYNWGSLLLFVVYRRIVVSSSKESSHISQIIIRPDPPGNWINILDNISLYTPVIYMYVLFITSHIVNVFRPLKKKLSKIN